MLIRAMRLGECAQIISKPQFYITHNYWSYPKHTLKWDTLFDPEKETSVAIAWISFPWLTLIFFSKKVVFSLAVAVEKPLQVDLAMQNKSKPSCARVKIAVDLFKEFSKRINAGMRLKNGEIKERRINLGMIICQNIVKHANYKDIMRRNIL